MPYRNFAVIFASSLLCFCLSGCTPNTDSAPVSGYTPPDSVLAINTTPLELADHTLHGQSDDLWVNLAENFHLNHYTNKPQVRAQIHWYLTHKTYLHILCENASPYVYYIYQQVKKRHLPAELVLLPMIESNYNPFAYSSAGAAGLWQLMPGTASGYGLKQNWWYNGRRDVISSTRGALDYMVYLSNFFNDHWLLVIASYDGGEGTIQQSQWRNQRLDRPTDFWNLRLPAETEAYVPKLLALAAIIGNPKKYGVTLPPIKDVPYLAEVKVGSQLDLAHAARMAGISIKEFSNLNPGFNRWATAPNGPFRLLLPIDKVAQFKANYARLPKSKRVAWKRYRVQKGDTLGGIANHFETSIQLLKQVNKLQTSFLRVGERLLIPMDTSEISNYVLGQERNYLDAQENIPGPQRVVHTIHSGDSLWDIARLYGVTVRQITFWNKGLMPDSLKPGRKIIIWMQPQHRYYAYHHSHRSHHRAYAHGEEVYYVKPGDNLDGIALKYQVSLQDLKSANHMHSDLLSLHQKLIIPANNGQTPRQHRIAKTKTNHWFNYIVQPGDSLWTISKHFDLKINAIKKWNAMNSNALKPGQVLAIYT